MGDTTDRRTEAARWLLEWVGEEDTTEESIMRYREAVDVVVALVVGEEVERLHHEVERDIARIKERIRRGARPAKRAFRP